jgi:tetratricopeptide (TPR) repeat protein
VLPARLLVLTAAVVLAGFAAITLSDTRACREDSKMLARFAFGADEPITDGFVDELPERCRGARALATASVTLTRRGRSAQAVRLADEAIRREPRNHEGWIALAAALRSRGLEEAADRAQREALRLNPRFAPATG